MLFRAFAAVSLTFLFLLSRRLISSERFLTPLEPFSSSTVLSSFARKPEVIFIQFKYEVDDLRFSIFSSGSLNRYFASANMRSRKCLYFNSPLQERNLFLQPGRYLGYAELEELYIVLNGLAEILDLIEPGFQGRVILVLLGPEPEIVSGIAIGPTLCFPSFIFIERLFKDDRVPEIIGAVLPFIYKKVAFFSDLLFFTLNLWVVIVFKELFKVPFYLFHLLCPFMSNVKYGNELIIVRIIVSRLIKKL